MFKKFSKEDIEQTCFDDLGLSRLGFEHPTFRLWCKRSNPLRHRVGHLHGCCIVTYIFIHNKDRVFSNI